MFPLHPTLTSEGGVNLEAPVALSPNGNESGILS
jgi:hypothetical protein